MLERILDYLRSFFPDSLEGSRKRSHSGTIESPIGPKVRKFSPSYNLHRAESNWLYNNSRQGGMASGLTINVDDDDDVIEISRHKSPGNVGNRRNKSIGITSTPQYGGIRNGHSADDDIMFLKCTDSAAEKKLNAKRREFCYIDRSSFLRDLNGRSDQNGHNEVSPVLTIGRDFKSTSEKPKIQLSSVLNETFRLDEKQRYRELLSDSAPTSSLITWRKKLNAFSKYTSPSDKTSNYSRGKKLVDLAHKSKETEFIDLTNNAKPVSRLSTRGTIQKVLKDFDSEPIIIKDSDSDIEVLPCPPSPKPEFKIDRINSLKTVIDSVEHTHSSWLHSLVQKHKEDYEKRQKTINEHITQVEQLGEINNFLHTKKLEDRVNRCLHIKDFVLPVSAYEEETALPSLTDEHLAVIRHALNKRADQSEVLARKFNLNISRRDLMTLDGLNWLNDEVINFYMNLMIERGKDSKWPNTYAVNTFFYPKLLKDGPSSLRRWTKKVDIFSHDLIIVPIHLGLHWCMAIIDFRHSTIKYYDSMGSTNRRCLESLLKYLRAEHLDKKKCEFNVDHWELENVKDIPQQMNGSDCGMFACTFAEYITRNGKITFNQEDMPYFRNKMVYEIISGQLLIS